MKKMPLLLLLCTLGAGCAGTVAAGSHTEGSAAHGGQSEADRLIRDWNEQVRSAGANEVWPRSAVGAASRLFAEPIRAMQIEMTVVYINEVPDSARVTVVSEGLLNDSVRGRKVSALVVLGGDMKWSVADVEITWRCWAGRGHTDWSRELCE
jgi:hypothetical protein